LALETLAYGVPGVQCGRTHVERLRALVNWAGLPVDVPETLPAFRKWASEQDEPLSGPAAVVSVRNWVTHPTDANTKDLASLPPSDRHQAWYLALWYLDVSILHLLNYNGPYRNRANGGAYEAVPWASSDPHHI
jgi:hypothetical protein